MIQKKICMLGAFAVGKTSLVSRFIVGLFSDKYLTTVGVKIDKRSVQVSGQEVNLILWDLHGEDEFQKVRLSYLRGASGYFLVVDGTRRTTLDTASRLQKVAEETLGKVPFVVLLNKSDLSDEWELDDDAINTLANRNWQVIRTSAKTGMGVEDAFLSLAQQMVERQ
jgi:small GTP-binding protein